MSKSSYEFSKATFMPFHLPDRFGFKLSAWYAAILLIICTLLFPFIASFIQKLIPLALAMEASPDSPEALNDLMSLYSSVTAGYYLFVAASAVIAASFSGAFLRKIFRPEQPNGVFPLRLGMEEIRILGAKFIVSLIVFAALFAGYIVAMIFGVLAAISVESSPSIGMTLFVIAFLVILVAYIAMLYVAIRLAPAAALCVRDQKFRLFEAWRVTKGRIWPMVGSFVVAYLAFIVPLMLLSLAMIALPFLAGGGFEAVTKLETSEDPQIAIAQLFDGLMSPASVLLFLVFGGLAMFVAVLMQFCFSGVPAYATLLWARDNNIEPTILPYPPTKPREKS